jgi:hypothetical protein
LQEGVETIPKGSRVQVNSKRLTTLRSGTVLINKVADIPIDYRGLMGVPITFIDKYNPEQFEILGIDRVLVEEATGKVSRFRINDKEIYARIIIKNRKI